MAPADLESQVGQAGRLARKGSAALRMARRVISCPAVSVQPDPPDRLALALVLVPKAMSPRALPAKAVRATAKRIATAYPADRVDPADRLDQLDQLDQ